MLTIHLTRRADSSVALRLSCPDALIFQGCINVLKFEIPPPYRRFDKFTKSWIILFEAAVELERYISLMVAKYCADVLIENQEQNEPETNQQKENSTRREEGTPFERIRIISVRQAYAALYVIPEAPFEIVQAAYRTLAKIHHPDKGGDGRLMRVFNQAYEVICDEVKKRSASAA